MYSLLGFALLEINSYLSKKKNIYLLLELKLNMRCSQLGYQLYMLLLWLLLLIIEERARLGHFDSNLDPLRSLYDIQPCWLCFYDKLYFG